MGSKNSLFPLFLVSIVKLFFDMTFSMVLELISCLAAIYLKGEDDFSFLILLGLILP